MYTFVELVTEIGALGMSMGNGES